VKLPNGDQATLDSRKVIDYCLNPDHEEGQHKARVFQSILGLTLNNADLLLEALRNAAATGEATLGRKDRYGQRYVIDSPFTGPSGAAMIRSAWIIGSNETMPRMVTCYIL
jgi:hypothetical protein